MDFSPILEELALSKKAGRTYEKEGHGKFRDCLTVCRSGDLLFERYCYGEAAGLVFSLWGRCPAPGAPISWQEDPSSSYSGLEDAPKQLTALQDGALELDGGRLLWRPVATLSKAPSPPSSFRKFFSKLRKK